MAKPKIKLCRELREAQDVFIFKAAMMLSDRRERKWRMVKRLIEIIERRSPIIVSQQEFLRRIYLRADKRLDAKARQ